MLSFNLIYFIDLFNLLIIDYNIEFADHFILFYYFFFYFIY